SRRSWTARTGPARTRRPRSKSTRARELMRELAAIVFAGAACGAETPHAHTASLAAPDAALWSRDAAAAPAEAQLPTLDEIAGASAALGMREAVRLDGAAPMDRVIARAAEHDACARAAFVANGPIDVALVDGTGAILVEHRAVTRGFIGT